MFTVAFAAMCLILVASCDQAGMKAMSSEEPAPTPTPTPEPTPTADIFDYVYNPQGEGENVINDDSTLVNKVKYASPGWAKMTIVNDTLKYFAEDVDMSANGLKAMVAKANAEAAAMAKAKSTNGADTLTNASRSFSIFGTRQGVTIESQKMRRVINGKPAAYLIDDAIELVEIRDVTPAKTRAEEWILSSENIIEVVGKVVSHEAGLSDRSPRTGLTQLLTKRFLVQKYEKNDFVSNKEIDSDRKATSATDEFGKKTYRFYRKDNSYEDFDYLVPMNYSINPRKYDPMTVKSFDNWKFSYAASIDWTGNESKAKETDTYKIYQREGTGLAHYASYESFDVLYDATSQRCEYNDGTVKFSFGYEDIKLSGRSHNVSPQATSDRAGYDEALFNENLTATYLGYNQDVKSSRVLYKEKAREPEVPVDSIIDADWYTVSASKKHEADQSTFKIQWRIRHSIKDDEYIDYELVRDRSLKNKSEWKVYVSEKRQNTEACSVETKETEGTKKDKDGAIWAFKKVVVNAKAKTYFTGGDVEYKENEIEAEETNEVTITREGKVYSFGKDNVNASHNNGKLGSEYSVTEGKAYDYTLTWKYFFGNADTKQVESPGTLIIKATEPESEPDPTTTEPEKEPEPTPTPTTTPNITGVVQTTAPAKGRTDWMTVIVVSYEDGYKVPILCPSDGSSKPTFGSDYKEKTTVAYNSAVWSGSTYILVTAQDDGNYMSFNRDGKRKDAITYDKAVSLHWNNDIKIKFGDKEHYSVKSERFTISYSGAKITLKDTYNGNKTWEF